MRTAKQPLSSGVCLLISNSSPLAEHLSLWGAYVVLSGQRFKREWPSLCVSQLDGRQAIYRRPNRRLHLHIRASVYSSLASWCSGVNVSESNS